MLTEYLCFSNYYNVLRHNTEKNTKDSPLVLLLLVYTNIVSLVVSSPFRLAAKIASPHCSAIVGGCCVAQTCSYLPVVKVWAFMLVLSAVSGRLSPTDFGRPSKCFYTWKKRVPWLTGWRFFLGQNRYQEQNQDSFIRLTGGLSYCSFLGLLKPSQVNQNSVRWHLAWPSQEWL